MRAMMMATVGAAALGALTLAAPGGRALAQDDEDPDLLAARVEAAQAYMEGVMEPTAETLWNSVGYIITEEGEQDLSPKNDEEWAEVVARAEALMNVAEELKTVPFRWQDDDWDQYAQGIKDVAEMNRQAALHQSIDEMYDAGEVLDKACEACHQHYEAMIPPELLIEDE